MRSIAAATQEMVLPQLLPTGGGVGQIESYDFVTLTPMFGGGVEAGHVDMDNPIRVPSIRGHLRAWWRFLFADQFSDKDLLREEVKIWGGLCSADGSSDSPATTPSKVSLSVKIDSKPQKQKVFNPNKSDIDMDAKQYQNTSYPTYALFPFQGNRDDPRQKEGFAEGIRFTLTVTYHPSLTEEQKDQVRDSLRAWANFGGIGARTRRGCGAVHSIALGFADKGDIAEFFSSHKKKIGILYKKEASDPVLAWINIIQTLRDFRQGVGLGRNPGETPKRPGRSRWPEPDTIRRKTGKHSSMHSPNPQMPDGFPRASFGLPINFHFKDKDDPADFLLVPLDKKGQPLNRMASPVFLRPFKTKEGVYQLALFFPPAKIEGLGDNKKQHTLSPALPYVMDPKFTTYRNAPMENRSSTGDALQAYKKYLKDKGFEEA